MIIFAEHRSFSNQLTIELWKIETPVKSLCPVVRMVNFGRWYELKFQIHFYIVCKETPPSLALPDIKTMEINY